jgi:hypothetical protein
MIHWFQSIEGLLLLALDGRSLSGLPNCAIFRKTPTTVPEVRQDDVYRLLIEEVSSITHVVSESFVVKYHKYCCKSYTSKQNITCFAHKKTTKEVPDSKSSSVQLYVQMVLLPDLRLYFII